MTNLVRFYSKEQKVQDNHYIKLVTLPKREVNRTRKLT